MQTVLFPGSFDPVTAGHLDIIRRASALFDRVVVGVLHNPDKPSGAFAVEERLALLRLATDGLSNVSVRPFTGLLVDAAREAGVDGVLRSLRTAADTDAELQMARLNRQLSGIETVLIASAPEFVHISSSYVRAIGRMGGSLAGLVPESVHERISETLARLHKG